KLYHVYNMTLNMDYILSTVVKYLKDKNVITYIIGDYTWNLFFSMSSLITNNYIYFDPIFVFNKPDVYPTELIDLVNLANEYSYNIELTMIDYVRYHVENILNTLPQNIL